MDTFQRISTPPTNYVGTALFISYIIAALAFTASITLNISQRYTKTYNASPNDGDPRVHLSLSVRRKAAFAAICFTALSYTMISVLVTSHHRWFRNNLPYPSPSISNVEEWSTRLWHWMLQTSLFRDFANDLLLTSGTVLWSQLALLWTGAAMGWMGLRGKSGGINGGVKGLWRYFALGQILPVSFAVNLLAIDLTITHYEKDNRARSSTKQEKADAVSSTGDRPRGEGLLYNWYVVMLGAINTAYAACIISLSPHALESGYLVTGIFVLRGLLLSPLLVPVQQSNVERKSALDMIVLSPFVVAAARVLYIALQSSGPMKDMIGAVNTAPAVQAIGWDAVLGLASTVFALSI